MTTRDCLDCEVRPGNHGRGLCDRCYGRRRHAGTLDERPVIGDQRPGVAEVLRIEGLTYRKLDYWVRQGYLKPGNATAGTGNWREWPYGERRVAELMARLTAAGLSVAAAHRVAREGGCVELAPGIRIEVTTAA